MHLGHKLVHTARTYNMTVNHCRRILNTAKGYTTRFNDKTLVFFDDLINQLHNGKFDDVHKITLMAFDQEGVIIEVKCKGCYVIVNNRYLNWSVNVHPMKETNGRSEIRFSEWLESLRKEVSCTFGILKGRS